MLGGERRPSCVVSAFVEEGALPPQVEVASWCFALACWRLTVSFLEMVATAALLQYQCRHVSVGMVDLEGALGLVILHGLRRISILGASPPCCIAWRRSSRVSR